MAARPGDAARRGCLCGFSGSYGADGDGSRRAVGVAPTRRPPPPANGSRERGEVRWSDGARDRARPHPLDSSRPPPKLLGEVNCIRGRRVACTRMDSLPPRRAPPPGPLPARSCAERGDRTFGRLATAGPTRSISLPHAVSLGGSGRGRARDPRASACLRSRSAPSSALREGAPRAGSTARPHSTRRTRHASSTAATTSEITSPSHTPCAPHPRCGTPAGTPPARRSPSTPGR